MLWCVQEAGGRSLWAMTWMLSRDISSGLTPQLLASTGVSLRPPPQQLAASQSSAQPLGATGPSASAVQAPESSALAAALAAAQQELATHELAELEAESSAAEAVAALQPELSNLEREEAAATGMREEDVVSEPATGAENSAKDVSSPAVTEGTDDPAGNSATADAGKCEVEDKSHLAEDTAARALQFSVQQQSMPAANASHQDVGPQPSIGEQHPIVLEQEQQGDLREGDGVDEDAEAEQAGGACKQS